jgi:hypothetical protein
MGKSHGCIGNYYKKKKKNFLEGVYDGRINVNDYGSIIPHPIVYGIYSKVSLKIIQKLVELGSDVNARCILTGTVANSSRCNF